MKMNRNIIGMIMLILNGSIAHAQTDSRMTPAEAFKQFGQKVEQADLDLMVAALKDFENLPDIHLTAEDLLLPTDDPALTAGGLALQERFQIISHEIAKMEMSAYRLNALLKLVPANDETEVNSTSLTLYQTQSEIFQGSWHRVIRALTDLRLDKTKHNLEASIQKCQTQACVATVGEAFKELNRLGVKLNQDLDVNQLQDFNASFKFQNPYIRRTLKETINHLVGVNKKNNAFKTLAKIAISPFVFAAREVHSFGNYFVQIFTHLKIERKKLFARAYQREINRKGKLVDRRTAWAAQVKADVGALIKTELARTGKNENASYDQDYQAALTAPVVEEPVPAAESSVPKMPALSDLQKQYPNIFPSPKRLVGLQSYFKQLFDLGYQLMQNYSAILGNANLQSEFVSNFLKTLNMDFAGKNESFDSNWEMKKTIDNNNSAYNNLIYFEMSNSIKKYDTDTERNGAKILPIYLEAQKLGMCWIDASFNPSLQSINAFKKLGWYTSAKIEQPNFSLDPTTEFNTRKTIVPLFYRCRDFVDSNEALYVIFSKRSALANAPAWFAGNKLYSDFSDSRKLVFFKSDIVSLLNHTEIKIVNGNPNDFNLNVFLPEAGVE
jgi:hypothetical protein